MKITEQNETAEFYNFVFSDNSTCSVGKLSLSNPDGAANYEDALGTLLLNFPDLELS